MEGQDLTVRNGEVFLKKLAGLEPLEGIFRHIGDLGIDPFALRRQTGTGVAGIIQAQRERNVALVNHIGAGFVDTPVLSVFLPELSRQLLEEDLLLESHPAWWCGRPDDRKRVLADLGRLVVGPAMDRSAGVDRSDPAGAIRSTPFAYMAMEPVFPAASHAWLSLFVPESGWVDLDPTNNIIPGENHITLAWGRDYSDVTPVKGVVMGGGMHTLSVNVDVAGLS